MDHFLQVMRIRGGLSPAQRHLMVLDGHTSHVTLNVIIKAYEAGLDMVTLPSHTSHALQPLDVACFRPFKTAFRVYRDIWSIANKGQQCKKEDLAQWMSLSLKKALTPENIKAGFRATGILPLDKDRMSAKMGPSEGFNHKAQDIQIEEILEELVPLPKENVVHYYVDIEGQSSISTAAENNARTSFSHMLRLPQQEIRNPRMKIEPLVDYSHQSSIEWGWLLWQTREQLH
jgi:hypothetical protein